jgi:hypothetical protein
MYGEPSAVQLIEAVALFLEKTALPKLEGHAAFHGKVALNVLAIVKRELELGAAADDRERSALAALLSRDAVLNELRADLCEQIRVGVRDEKDEALLTLLLQTTAARVAIEQPSYASLARAQA